MAHYVEDDDWQEDDYYYESDYSDDCVPGGVYTADDMYDEEY